MYLRTVQHLTNRRRSWKDGHLLFLLFIDFIQVSKKNRLQVACISFKI